MDKEAIRKALKDFILHGYKKAPSISEMDYWLRELLEENERLEIAASVDVSLGNTVAEMNKEIESLRAAIEQYSQQHRAIESKLIQAERQWDEAWHISQSKIIDLTRERDEARQENARLRAIDERECLITISVHRENEKLRQANAALLEGLRKLPDEIMQIDRFSDVEELTFPLLDPTEEDQNEWFDDFCSRMRDYIEGCIEDLVAQYAPEPTEEDTP